MHNRSYYIFNTDFAEVISKVLFRCSFTERGNGTGIFIRRPGKESRIKIQEPGVRILDFFLVLEPQFLSAGLSIDKIQCSEMKNGTFGTGKYLKSGFP